MSFGFLGRSRGLAAFEDVLFSGTSGLDHLINRAVAFAKKTFAKSHRTVVNDAGFLESKKVLVAAMRWYEAFRHVDVGTNET